ncbi:nuclear transport factor 2 family protein [Amycolatopsis sp.]|uniref:nuclear transport factor 2 family protein n=1 Tax=Amycolatopsis sp. TaxID=37632 RepID=UPI002DFA67DA|nr:nuclear transport factor 2 family protein [Amycolatopsis sp.]
MVTAIAGTAGAEAGLAELRARLACEDVVRASFRLIDEGHATQAAGLYTADGSLTLSDATKQAGDVTLRGEDINHAMRHREDEDRETVHVLSQSSFQLTDPEVAESECQLQVYVLGDDRAESAKPGSLSRVRDELVRGADGLWRISARRITILAGRR